MQIHARTARRYLWIHIGLFCALLLFPLYQWLSRQIPQFLTRCFLHDRLFLYCPLCGGTRAIEALLHLDLLAALRYNSFVTFALLLAVCIDVWALVRLLRGKTELFVLPGWFWVVMTVLMIAYTVLRNYLMIAHGYDPTGDLVFIWNR